MTTRKRNSGLLRMKKPETRLKYAAVITGGGEIFVVRITKRYKSSEELERILDERFDMSDSHYVELAWPEIELIEI